MKFFNDFKELISNSLGEMTENIMGAIPNIFGALMILLIGWIVTKIIVGILKKILRLAKVDKLTDLINEKDVFGKTDLKFNVSKVILGFVKYLFYLAFLIVAADIMGWTIISEEIGNLLRYLPKLFSALALFMVGLYIATLIKKVVKNLFESFNLSGSKVISGLVFYVIAIITSITALNQAGIDTTIITNNLAIILGAFLAAIALGFGLGSKEIIGDLLKTYYTRRNYEIGQQIKFKNISGTIISIDGITFTVKTEKGRLVLPIKELVKNKVTLID